MMMFRLELYTKDVFLEAFWYTIGSCLLTTPYLALSAYLGNEVTVLDVVTSVTSFAYVGLCRKGNILNWPMGLLSFLSFAIYTLRLGLTGQGWMYVLYFSPMQIYGWWSWTKNISTELPVRTCSIKEWMACLSAWGFAIVVIHLVTNPLAGLIGWWDCSISAALAVGIYLISRMKIEGWLFTGLFVNLSGVILYSGMGKWMPVTLYVFFLINAMMAFWQWRRKIVTVSRSQSIMEMA